MNLIDSLTNNIKEARIRNFNIWPLLDVDIWATWGFQGINYATTYEGDTANMKNWLRQRLTWIDNNISKIYYKPPTSISTTFADATDNYTVFPNPFSNQIRVSFDGSKQGLYTFETLDIFGRKVIISDNVKLDGGFYEIVLEKEKISRLSPGLYIFTIRNNGIMVHQEKLVKQ
jgi:hypothetical protein